MKNLTKLNIPQNKILRNKKIIFGLLMVSLFLVAACTSENNEEIKKDVVINNHNGDNMADDTVNNKQDSAQMSAWLDSTLKNVRTGEEFKISDYKGKPVLIESFAIWCPSCKRQQQTMQELHEIVGEEVVIVSLDTDPNEDEQAVLDHVTNNEFNGMYSVSPTDFTQSLIDEFGVGVVNAPSVPVILVCEDQSTRLLDRGHKSVELLQEEIAKGCSA